MADRLLSELTDEDYFRAHLALENELVEMRDSRMGLLGYGNGLVIRERDGKESSVIRIGTNAALRIAVQAILNDYPIPEKTDG